jgi:hypothetical protein
MTIVSQPYQGDTTTTMPGRLQFVLIRRNVDQFQSTLDPNVRSYLGPGSLVDTPYCDALAS